MTEYIWLVLSYKWFGYSCNLIDAVFPNQSLAYSVLKLGVSLLIRSLESIVISGSTSIIKWEWTLSARCLINSHNTVRLLILIGLSTIGSKGSILWLVYNCLLSILILVVVLVYKFMISVWCISLLVIIQLSSTLWSKLVLRWCIIIGRKWPWLLSLSWLLVWWLLVMGCPGLLLDVLLLLSLLLLTTWFLVGNWVIPLLLMLRSLVYNWLIPTKREITVSTWGLKLFNEGFVAIHYFL